MSRPKHWICRRRIHWWKRLGRDASGHRLFVCRLCATMGVQ